MEFKQYPSYKPSGVEWLGDVPEHWESNRLKKYLIERNEKNSPIKTDNLLSVTMYQGVIPVSEKQGNGGNKPKENLENYKISYPNDIVLNSMNVIVGSVGLNKYMGLISPAYYALYNRNKNNNIKFFSYIFHNPFFQKGLFGLGNGIMYKESEDGKLNTIRLKIPMEKLNQVVLPCPSISQQNQIVAFLDTETTRIDNLIAKQEKLIELLEEQRKSIISHAVTKGLNPNAPMKDSGVEWLGEVPEHWKIGKLKRWFNTVSGGTPNSNNYAKYYKNGTHPWLRTTDLNNGILTSFEIGITDEAIKESSCKYVPEDSVLIAMYGGDGTIGKNALLKFKSTINQAICALIPNSHFNPEYSFFYIQFYRPYWMVNAMGGRKDPNINQQQIQDAYFVLPPFNEQNKIVDFLKKEHSRIDSLVLKQNQLIEKMKEYRASIISHAVTGKINVQEFGA